MSRPKIVVEELSAEQLQQLCIHLDELADVIVAANNTMTVKLAETEEIPDSCRTILNEWSTFLNSALEKSGAEVRRLLSTARKSLN